MRAEYLAYTSAEIDYYGGLNKQVFGYEPPQVMLLHDNRLNADVIEKVLQLFEEKQYRFVSLDEAQADAAYRTPETQITKFGPMWGYRWARERNVKVNGSLEPDPPKWVLEYGKARAKWIRFMVLFGLPVCFLFLLAGYGGRQFMRLLRTRRTGTI